MHCAFTCNLEVHFVFFFLFFSYCDNVKQTKHCSIFWISFFCNNLRWCTANYMVYYMAQFTVRFAASISRSFFHPLSRDVFLSLKILVLIFWICVFSFSSSIQPIVWDFKNAWISFLPKNKLINLQVLLKVQFKCTWLYSRSS